MPKGGGSKTPQLEDFPLSTDMVEKQGGKKSGRDLCEMASMLDLNIGCLLMVGFWQEWACAALKRLVEIVGVCDGFQLSMGLERFRLLLSDVCASVHSDKDKGLSNKTPKLDRSDGVKEMKEKAPKRKLPFTVGANGDQKDSDTVPLSSSARKPQEHSGHLLRSFPPSPSSCLHLTGLLITFAELSYAPDVYVALSHTSIFFSRSHYRVVFWANARHDLRFLHSGIEQTADELCRESVMDKGGGSGFADKRR
ncbi:hypothetical protein DNTS_007795 [Danionella cerebrum]|uniref:Uncharacterized protein n=1 Tax=Danionella cerebrum TaxID=2873325 RepID=A0A553RFG8_9TELE|nr:hypothetical protein DNTS_007795 [Danionella translucida]